MERERPACGPAGQAHLSGPPPWDTLQDEREELEHD